MIHTLQNAETRITGIINGMRRSGVDTRDYGDVVAYLEIKLPNMHRAMREQILEQLGINVPTHTWEPVDIMKFYQLKRDDEFNFYHGDLAPHIRHLGFEPGPWIKTGATTYRKKDDRNFTARVGSIKVRVELIRSKNPPLESREFTALEHAITEQTRRIERMKAANIARHFIVLEEKRLEDLQSIRQKHL